MKNIYLALLGLWGMGTVQAQSLCITNEKTKQPIAHVQITGQQTQQHWETNAQGCTILTGISPQKLHLEAPGFFALFLDYTQQTPQVWYVEMVPAGEALDAVVVSSTRVSRVSNQMATRVETIAGGELEEKVHTQPANIKMILSESTGIQTQQTSAASGNTSIRIQGLDGRYTQILVDGLPLFSGFSSGLSAVQLPPLNLKRVEVIKGTASTLYGGGAIAGLINFITKSPTDKRDWSVLANYNGSRATDFSAYASEKKGAWGYSVYASRNQQIAYDANADGFSDLPETLRYTFNPTLYSYQGRSQWRLGLNSLWENRTGGAMQALGYDRIDQATAYVENNRSRRLVGFGQYQWQPNVQTQWVVKSSISWFDRLWEIPTASFDGRQINQYHEVHWAQTHDLWSLVTGANVWLELFNPMGNTPSNLGSNLGIIGGFVQGEYGFKPYCKMEAGLRIDKAAGQQWFALPRLALWTRWAQGLTTRIGGGMGYKWPTLFTEQTEERGYQQLQPLDLNQVKAERSRSVQADVNYTWRTDEGWRWAWNQLMYYTRIDNPLEYEGSVIKNSEGYLDSRGFETNIKAQEDDLYAQLGYTFIEARTHEGQTLTQPLTAKHRLYLTASYEIEERFRFAYECFYTGNQLNSQRETKPYYWIMGLSVQYTWGIWTFFANAENFTDVRQSRYEAMYTGSLQQPKFASIWAPTDGFLWNMGTRIILK